MGNFAKPSTVRQASHRERSATLVLPRIGMDCSVRTGISPKAGQNRNQDPQIEPSGAVEEGQQHFFQGFPQQDRSFMASFKNLYEKVASRDDDSVVSEIDDRVHPPNSTRVRFSTVILSITTAILGLYSTYLTLWGGDRCSNVSFKNGYSTEWSPAKNSIQLEQVTYTSAIRYNGTDQTYYREFDPNQPQYVGNPGPHIDRAWDALLEGQYLTISEAEAFQLDDPVSIDGYYLAEVEVMHSLHCLNAVRKALSPEYYTKDHAHALLEQVKQIHIDHCLDQIRQSIQCAGDLTPLMLRPWGQGSNALFIGTPQVHTCRSWNQFRNWYTDRGNTFGKISTNSL